MNILNILLRLGSNVKSGNRWQASHKIDGVQTPQRPQVTAFDVGMKDGIPWIEHEFNEDGVAKKLFAQIGIGGSSDHILFTIDGVEHEVEDDDLVLSHRFRGAAIRGVVEYKFEFDGHDHRYRFDATIGSIA